MSQDTTTIESNSFEEICKSIRDTGRSLHSGEGYSRIVFTSGRFDLVHPGHLKLLNQCRRMAGPKGAVVVGVRSDKSIMATMEKGNPIIGEHQRCLLLIHLRLVDHVITFDDQVPDKLIERLRPDIIVMGSDSKGKKFGENLAPTIFVEEDKDFNTSSILEGIRHEGR